MIAMRPYADGVVYLPTLPAFRPLPEREYGDVFDACARCGSWAWSIQRVLTTGHGSATQTLDFGYLLRCRSCNATVPAPEVRTQAMGMD